MNINLTVLIQLLNVCVMVFVLKKILLDKVLEALKAKNLAHSLLFQKLSCNRQILAKVNQEPEVLWRKFKEQNSIVIVNNITNPFDQSNLPKTSSPSFNLDPIDVEQVHKTAVKLSNVIVTKSQEI